MSRGIEPNVVYQGIIYIYILLEKVELKIPDQQNEPCFFRNHYLDEVELFSRCYAKGDRHKGFNSERLSSAVCYFIHTKIYHRFYELNQNIHKNVHKVNNHLSN